MLTLKTYHNWMRDTVFRVYIFRENDTDPYISRLLTIGQWLHLKMTLEQFHGPLYTVWEYGDHNYSQQEVYDTFCMR